MVSLGISFGEKGAARAEVALEEAEDRLWMVDEEIEGADLKFHVKKDNDRAKLLILQHRQLRQIVNAKFDRTLQILVIGFGLLFVKGIFTLQDVFNVFKFFSGVNVTH